MHWDYWLYLNPNIQSLKRKQNIKWSQLLKSLSINLFQHVRMGSLACRVWAFLDQAWMDIITGTAEFLEQLLTVYPAKTEGWTMHMWQIPCLYGQIKAAEKIIIYIYQPSKSVKMQLPKNQAWAFPVPSRGRLQERNKTCLFVISTILFSLCDTVNTQNHSGFTLTQHSNPGCENISITMLPFQWGKFQQTL